jgi:hypothetical protein
MSVILCCGMIRSGSTVLYQIASAIVELRGIGERRGYYEPPHLPENPRVVPGWSVYKVPWLCEREKQMLRDPRDGAIALYSYRDIDEALESAYRAFQVPEGDRWLHRALNEAAKKDIASTKGNFHAVGFDSIRDRLWDVIAGASFAIPGRVLELWEIDAIAEDLSLERQKARPRIKPFDPHTLLCWNHFGK